MLTETIQLETLRQKIEDAEYEAGSQSDYLDRGNPNPAQAKQAQELINAQNQQSKALKAELKELIARVRSQQPQAIEEWVSVHSGILQKILSEKETGTTAVTRRNVARSILQEWEKVHSGEQEYVSINWYFLKDYKESVRKIGKNVKRANKAWWQFWK
jgi:hypothetical protein